MRTTRLASLIGMALAWGTLALPASAAPAVKDCGTSHIFRVTGTIQATGVSCQQGIRVFRAVERARLPSDVARTPYFRFSRSYRVSTPAGRFSCRRKPHGLGGSEHTIKCVRGVVHVDWDTTHD